MRWRPPPLTAGYRLVLRVNLPHFIAGAALGWMEGSMAERLFPVILSGGSGTRLWPLSREALPKQLLALHGSRTLIQDTALRCGLPQAAAPTLICNEQHRFLVAEQMLAIGCMPRAILLEPFARNTAPAATIAALSVAQETPDGVVLLLPSDHVVTDADAFADSVSTAVAAAAEGRIVTFGIAPTSPETGYGYIRAGAVLEGLNGALCVDSFVEKPDLAAAQHYLTEGGYFWNSGMFAFRADTFLDEVARRAPDVLSAARAAFVGAKTDLDYVRLDAAAFEASPSISLDHAVMERTGRAAVVPSDFGWSDVGAWSALWQIAEQDAAGNVLQGDVIAHDVTNSFVRADGRLVALIGVEGLAVVTSDDAVLVVSKDRAQDVKTIVDQLRACGRSEYARHTTVFRPWGHYTAIDEGERFQVKEIVVKPGGRLSLQTHHHRAEHWVVVRGTARVTRGDEVFSVHENESTYIPMGTAHRLENPGKIPLHLIEVQSGSYLGEDDILRLDDVYGRD